MAGPNNLYGAGLSGLQVAIQSLATAGHNIANVDTPGYSRQRVDLVTREAQGSGSGFSGGGVKVQTIRRIYDNFIGAQLRSSTSTVKQVERFHALSSTIDNVLANEDGGLGPAVQGFFEAFHALANDPTSIPARQLVLSESQALSQRFHTLDSYLDQQRVTVDGQIAEIVSEINSLAEGVAAINLKVVSTESIGSGQANDLRDRRDELIRELAERIDLNVFPQDDGSLNVTTGTGQVLVVGPNSGALGLQPSVYDPARSEVVYVSTGGNSGVLSSLISGGELGGLLDFRSQVLDATQNSLGRIAMAVSHEINAQHRLGTDLDGARGGDLLTDLDALAPVVFSHSGNTGAPPAAIGVELRDASALTASDYRLDRQGATYTLTRLDDGRQTTLTSFPGAGEIVDGLRLTLTSGAIASGDSFLIQPTRFAAEALGTGALTTREVAAAAPVRVTAGAGNTGTAALSELRANAPDQRLRITFDSPPTTFDVTDTSTGAVLASNVAYVSGATHAYNGLSFTLAGAAGAGDGFTVDHTVAGADAGNSGSVAVGPVTVGDSDPNLTGAVTITFNNPPGTFDVTGATTGWPTTAVAYTSGQPISFNGWTLSITGTPAAGDTFTIGPNAGGVGDNRNALLMGALQLAGAMEGGSATFEEANGQLITQVGVKVRQAEINLDAQQALHEQVAAARESTSGVNLDEEATDIMRFQRAYQASAQMLAVANEIFRTLLESMSR